MEHRLSIPHYISLGAGVQSSTLALIAAAGEVTPMPAGAIFADTQAEPQSVYQWLDWLETRLPFPVHRVTAGNLTQSVLTERTSKKGGRYFKTAIPFHTLSANGDAGRIPHRTCTVDYKIKPIMREIRKLARIKRGQNTVGVVQWIGISWDEMMRMKPSRDPWAQCRWPLIELRMTRLMCLDWMRERGFPEPPRSACVYCPFRSNLEWRHLQRNDPDGFAAAVAFDNKAREIRRNTSMDSKCFVHRSLQPLDQVDLRNDTDRGQLTLWDDECTGMCGV
jgi:hypothetical protein